MSQLNVPSASEFNRARQRAFFEGWRTLLSRQSGNLLPFEPVRRALQLTSSVDRGLQEIELDKIVGSLGRDREFSRSFLPKHDYTRERWQRVASLFDDRGFKPITVYKVSEVYFVVDGNHRVSVSRARGFKTIEAYVVEFETHVSIRHDDDLNTILQKGKRMGQ